jgi:hypothetical protein
VGRVLIRLEGRLVAPGRRLRAASWTFDTPPFTFSVNFFLISKLRKSRNGLGVGFAAMDEVEVRGKEQRRVAAARDRRSGPSLAGRQSTPFSERLPESKSPSRCGRLFHCLSPAPASVAPALESFALRTHKVGYSPTEYIATPFQLPACLHQTSGPHGAHTLTPSYFSVLTRSSSSRSTRMTRSGGGPPHQQLQGIRRLAFVYLARIQPGDAAHLDCRAAV